MAASRRPPRLDRVHGEIQGRRRKASDQVFAVVRSIPRGKVMTYGQIATLLRSRLSPRAVGWMLHACPKDVPWQRVVNASGGFSTERLPDIPPGLQRRLLRRERVPMREDGTVDLERGRFVPGPARKRAVPRAPSDRSDGPSFET